MASFHHLFARIGSRRFHRRLRRRFVQFLSQLHDRTAVLRDMHRVECTGGAGGNTSNTRAAGDDDRAEDRINGGDAGFNPSSIWHEVAVEGRS